MRVVFRLFHAICVAFPFETLNTRNFSTTAKQERTKNIKIWNDNKNKLDNWSISTWNTHKKSKTSTQLNDVKLNATFPLSPPLDLPFSFFDVSNNNNRIFPQTGINATRTTWIICTHVFLCDINIKLQTQFLHMRTDICLQIPHFTFYGNLF